MLYTGSWKGSSFFCFLLSLALIKICPVYPIGHSILCVLLGCPLIKALNVQKPWAFFFAICLIATSLCYVGNGNSLFSSYIQISVLSNGKIHHREEFFTKNGDIHGLKDLWILLMYDGAYVGIVIIIFGNSSSDTLALKIRTLTSLISLISKFSKKARMWGQWWR